MIAIVLLTALGVAAVVILQLRHPGSDIYQQSISIFGCIMPTIVALIAVIKGFDNGNDINGLKIQMNGHTEQMRKDVAQVATLTERALNASELYPNEITPTGTPIQKQIPERSVESHL
jgi:hypothetical protein